MNLPGTSRGGALISGTILLLTAAVVAVLVCYLVPLNQAAAQQAAKEQYDAEQGTSSPAPEQTAEEEQVTLCHATASGNFVEITVDRNATAHLDHPNDIIPAPPDGCPASTATAGPTTPEPTTPEPTTPEPTSTATSTATVEPTDDGGCPHPEPTTASPTATATATASQTATAEGTIASPTATAGSTATPTGTASPPWTATPTAIATKPGEIPDGEVEVTNPDGKVSTITLYDLDVDDDPPLPGGPGGITRSEVLGQQAAAQTLVEGGNFHQAVAAAQPYLNSCDSRDAVRLTAFQLGMPLPDTGGASLGIIAAMLLVGSGIFAWRLGLRGRR